MKKTIKIMLLIIFSTHFIACVPRQTIINRNNGIFDMDVWGAFDFEGNIRVPMEDFQGSLSDKIDNLERYGLKIYYFVTFTDFRGTEFVDRNGICYILYQRNMKEADCDIRGEEILNMGIYIKDERNNISIISAFGVQEERAHFFHHNTRINMIRGTEGYNLTAIMLFNRYDFQNEYIIHSFELFVFHHQNREYSCFFERCNIFYLQHVCDEGFVREYGQAMKMQLERILIDDIGFNNFEEIGAFLRAYFFEYVIPFMEKLIEQLN